MGMFDSLLALFVGGGLLNSNSLSPTSPAGLSVDTSTTPSGPFLLQLSSSRFAKRHLRKRQSFAFVVTQGTVPACQGATTYTLVGDQLYAGGALVTADPGEAAYQPFPGSHSDGPVSGGFSVDEERGLLQWSSSNFSLGNATFCISRANVIYAVFAPGSAPSDCTHIGLNRVAASNCPLPISIGGSTIVNIYGTQNNYYSGGAGGASSSGSSGSIDSSSSSGSPGSYGSPGSTDSSGSLVGASPWAGAGASSSSGIVEDQPRPVQNGSNGQNGKNGANGLNGTNGTAGAAGATGATGATGGTGSTGAQGPQGPQGYNGTNGINGINGVNGVNGINGINGINGTNGTTGPPGPQGPPGASGGSSGATTYGGYAYSGCWTVSAATLGGNPVLASEIITVSIDECADYCATANTGNQPSLYFTLGSQPNLATPGGFDSVCTCTNTFQGSTVTSQTMYACNTPCSFTNADGSTAYCGAYSRGFHFASVFVAV